MRGQLLKTDWGSKKERGLLQWHFTQNHIYQSNIGHHANTVIVPISCEKGIVLILFLFWFNVLVNASWWLWVEYVFVIVYVFWSIWGLLSVVPLVQVSLYPFNILHALLYSYTYTTVYLSSHELHHSSHILFSSEQIDWSGISESSCHQIFLIWRTKISACDLSQL